MIAAEPKVKGQRIVVITQGPKPVLVAKTGDQKVTEYPVPAIDSKKVIGKIKFMITRFSIDFLIYYFFYLDTNGAGDAFTGKKLFLPVFFSKKHT